MLRKLISVMLALLLVCVPLAQISNAQWGLPKIPGITKSKEDEKQNEDKERRKEREKFRKIAAGQGRKCGKKGKAEEIGGRIVGVFTGGQNNVIAEGLDFLFNDELPVRLNACSVYDEAPTPENFKPKFFQLTADNLETILPPDDYTIPVRASCTNYSIHIPGRGVGYKLAPLEGKQAEALSTLLVRGNIAGISHDELQAISSAIQASLTYGQLSKERQKIIDELIPEFKRDLSGDFIQKLEDHYNKYVSEHSKVLPLDKLLEQTGISANVRNIRRSREVIRDQSLNAQKLQQRLFDGEPGESPVLTPDKPETSPWTEMMPGVYTQYVVKDGWQGINELNIRITSEAGMVSTTADQTPEGFFHRASFTPNRAAINPGIAVGIIFGIARAVGTRATVGAGGRIAAGAGSRALGWSITRGIIAYSVRHATQALIILPNVKPGDGGDDNNPKDEPNLSKDQKERIDKSLDRIKKADKLFPKDGENFVNKEGLLPKRESGYYKRYGVDPPQGQSGSSERLVIGRGGEVYYSPNHYGQFIRIK